MGGRLVLRAGHHLSARPTSSRCGPASPTTRAQSRTSSARPRIPDGDRHWLSLGAGWQPLSWLDLDASFTYIDVETPNVRLVAADTGNAPRGNLDADYDSYIILLGLSARMRF